MSRDELNQILQHNLDIMLMIDTPKKCPYADRIYAKKESVDCKYSEETDDIAAGSDGINANPNYPHIMVGQGLKYQSGFQESQKHTDYYTDDNNTNIYYGIYNLIG